MLNRQFVVGAVLMLASVLIACGPPTTKQNLDSFEEVNIIDKMFFTKCVERNAVRDIKACDQHPAGNQKHTDCTATVKGTYADTSSSDRMTWLANQGCSITPENGRFKIEATQ